MVATDTNHNATIYNTDRWQSVGKAAEVDQIVSFSPNSKCLLMRGRGRGRHGMNRTTLIALPSAKTLCTIVRWPDCKLIMSPDGNWALGHTSSFQPNGALCLWNARTGKRVRQFKAGREFISIYPQDFVLPNDRTEPTTVRSTATLTRHERHVWRRAGTNYRPTPMLKPSVKNSIAQISGLDKQGQAWLERKVIQQTRDPLVKTGKTLREFAIPEMTQSAVVVNSDATVLWAAYHTARLQVGPRARTIVAWNIKTGERIRTMDAIQNKPTENAKKRYAGNIERLMLSPDERYLAVGYEYCAVLFNLNNGTQDIVSSHGGSEKMQFSPDSKSIFCCGSKRTLWSTEQRKQLAVFGSKNGVGPWAFSPGGGYLLVRSDGFKSSNTLWDAHTGKVVNKFCQRTRFKFSPLGNRFVAWNGKILQLWDMEAGRLLADLSTDVGPGCQGIYFSPAGKLVVIHREQFSIWNTESGKQIGKQPCAPLSAHRKTQAFFLGPVRIVIVHRDGARVWDVQRGNLLHHFVGEPHHAMFVVLSPDKKSLCVVTPGKSSTLWDLASGEKRQVFEGLRGTVELADNQRQLLEYCRRNQLVKVWDIATGKVLRQIHLTGSSENLVIE